MPQAYRQTLKKPLVRDLFPRKFRQRLYLHYFADKRNAYILMDRATYLTRKKEIQTCPSGRKGSAAFELDRSNSGKPGAFSLRQRLRREGFHRLALR